MKEIRLDKFIKWFLTIAFSIAMAFNINWDGITPLSICLTFFCFGLMLIWFDWSVEE